MQLSIVVPIYRNANNAIQQLKHTLEFLHAEYTTFELIFIIDNDFIEEDIKNMLLIDEHIFLYILDKNYGQHFATLCGFYLAKGDYIMSIDEDMIQYIPQIKTNNSNIANEIVYFNYNKYDMYKSSVRRIMSKLFNNSILLIAPIKYHSSFRVISKHIRDEIVNQKHIYFNLDLMLYDTKEKIVSIPLDTNGLTDAASSYNLMSLTVFAYKFIYESNPIVLVSLFCLFPTAIYFLYTFNVFSTIIAYVFMVCIATGIIYLNKKNTISTKTKIHTALKHYKESLSIAQ